MFVLPLDIDAQLPHGPFDSISVRRREHKEFRFGFEFVGGSIGVTVHSFRQDWSEKSGISTREATSCQVVRGIFEDDVRIRSSKSERVDARSPRTFRWPFTQLLGGFDVDWQRDTIV
jgi:hypothetical protein